MVVGRTAVEFEGTETVAVRVIVDVDAPVLLDDVGGAAVPDEVLENGGDCHDCQLTVAPMEEKMQFSQGLTKVQLDPQIVAIHGEDDAVLMVLLNCELVCVDALTDELVKAPLVEGGPVKVDSGGTSVVKVAVFDPVDDAVRGRVAVSVEVLV